MRVRERRSDSPEKRAHQLPHHLDPTLIKYYEGIEISSNINHPSIALITLLCSKRAFTKHITFFNINLTLPI